MVTIFLSLAGFYYQIRKPTRHIIEKFYTVEIAKNLSICSLSEYQSLADEEVSLIRIGNIQQSIGISKDSMVSTARISPKVFKIGVSSFNRPGLSEDINKVEDYLSKLLSNKNYSFQGQGAEIYSIRKPNAYFGLIAGFAAGLFLSLVISSVREYLKKY